MISQHLLSKAQQLDAMRHVRNGCLYVVPALLYLRRSAATCQGDTPTRSSV